MKWSRFLALAVTFPLSLTVAMAQGARDADIWSYSQDLEMRIERGRQSGALDSAQYNNLKGLWSNIENLRRPYDNRTMEGQVRVNMMASLTNLDKMLTDSLHDNENSHYQQWDAGSRTWHHNWWSKDNNQDTSFDQEIDAYQRNIKTRIDNGRRDGKIDPSEFQRLSNDYNTIDRTQQQYRLAGYSTYERNSLNSMLANLDRDVTRDLRDDDQSHYRNWNDNSKSWNNNWWQNGGGNNPNVQVNVAADQAFDRQINAYQANLKQRMDAGKANGRLTESEYRRLSNTYYDLERTQNNMRNGSYTPGERNALMNRFTQFDREITAQLNDAQQSHFADWNSGSNSWTKDWWSNVTGNIITSPIDRAADVAFDQQINAYQVNLKQRIDAGKASGRLTQSEYRRLIGTYYDLEKAQSNLRAGSYTPAEKNSLMMRFTQFDRDITTQLNDSQQSHFADWNPNSNSWNRDWWKNGGGVNVQVSNANLAQINSTKLALRNDIDANARSGKLNARAVSDLNDQYNSIERMQQSYINGGYNNTERERMMSAMDSLRANLSVKLQNSNQRQTYDRRGGGWRNRQN